MKVKSMLQALAVFALLATLVGFAPMAVNAAAPANAPADKVQTFEVGQSMDCKTNQAQTYYHVVGNVKKGREPVNGTNRFTIFLTAEDVAYLNAVFAGQLGDVAKQGAFAYVCSTHDTTKPPAPELTFEFVLNVPFTINTQACVITGQKGVQGNHKAQVSLSTNELVAAFNAVAKQPKALRALIVSTFGHLCEGNNVVTPTPVVFTSTPTTMPTFTSLPGTDPTQSTDATPIPTFTSVSTDPTAAPADPTATTSSSLPTVAANTPIPANTATPNTANGSSDNQATCNMQAALGSAARNACTQSDVDAWNAAHPTPKPVVMVCAWNSQQKGAKMVDASKVPGGFSVPADQAACEASMK